MKIVTQIIEGFSRWLYHVALTLNGIKTRLSPARRLRVTETASGDFVIEPGQGLPQQTLRFDDDGLAGPMPSALPDLIKSAEVEILLRPSRFLHCPLELPERAGDFLGGVVRSQIDRLTPWNAHDAIYGWSPPQPAGPGRIVVTVVATARALVQPYCDAFAGLGASAVRAMALPSDTGAGEPIGLGDRGPADTGNIARLQKQLAIVLLAVSLIAAAATAIANYSGARLETQQDELVRRITAQRAALRDAGSATSGGGSALDLLERRKHDSPARVLLLEALSRALPDNTYVTALEISDRRAKITGVTKDAPALIRLIEQSDYFSDATFFAPTTRGPADPGERFHIETQIERTGAGAR